MAIAVDTAPQVRRASSSSSAPDAQPPIPHARRNSTLFRRVSAQAMGMEHDSLCHKSHWVPKSSRSACSNCKRAFRVFHAKHNCRLCGEVVCGTCSTKRILFQKKSVRSCDECVNQSVESISRINRRSSCCSPVEAHDESSSDETKQRLPKRSSESDIFTRKSLETPEPSAATQRRRGQSQPVAIATRPTSSKALEYKHIYKPVPRVESWRLQLPYVIVFFLMTVAGITNFLALTA